MRNSFKKVNIVYVHTYIVSTFFWGQPAVEVVVLA
jgi:hypothetical protein